MSSHQPIRIHLQRDWIEGLGSFLFAALLAWLAFSSDTRWELPLMVFVAAKGLLYLIPNLCSPHLIIGQEALTIRPRWRCKPIVIPWTQIDSIRRVSKWRLFNLTVSYDQGRTVVIATSRMSKKARSGLVDVLEKQFLGRLLD